ncbi:MAG: FKBP-type peptidyl-prolyl cis-trans isomerase [Flavobacteriales bacterium]|nr:FKBP-type peptidyl-prolyl cis-trans isomerase [Flavobacteriales bacterium]
MTIKIINSIAVVALLTFASCEAPVKEKAPISMDNEIDKVSYSLGVSVGENVKKQGFTDLNVDALAQAMKDVMGGEATQLTVEEANQALQTYFAGLRESKDVDLRKAGNDFLAANAKKEGIVTTASGLQYEILTEGTGEKPAATSKVTTHYHGTTIDGNVFDSSVERGEPIQFAATGVISSETEAETREKILCQFRLGQIKF